MLNIEKYEEDIKKQLATGRDIPCIIRELKDGDCNEDQNCQVCSIEMLKWLSQEYKEPILTDEEKVIIKNILKAFEPFGKELSYITKEHWDYGENCYLNFKYGDDSFGTLTFNQDKLFKGMEIDKHYVLGDLKLC